jgi:hypothetical protein
MAVMMSKVVEEYVFQVEGVGHVVKGRITYGNQEPNETGIYEWSISHFYKSDMTAMAAYRPSRTTARHIDDVRADLFAYANKFTNIGVESNYFY